MTDYAQVGATLRARTAEGASHGLWVRVVATAPLERVDIIRSGEVVESIPAGGRLEFSLQREVRALRSGEYLYVRAVQEDGGAAWSSPFAVE